jgi:hypothetical protein
VLRRLGAVPATYPDDKLVVAEARG